MQKPRAVCECLNDLDDRIIQVFRVLRNPKKAKDLRRRLELTPFARTEFHESYQDTDDDDEIEAVRRTITLAFMGFGSDSLGRGYRTGFRVTRGNRAFPSQEWSKWPAEIPFFLERLKGVVIENRDAIELIPRLDSVNTLFYVDPPYLPSTRSSKVGKHGYKHELTVKCHRRLAGVLRSLKGMVVLNGYPSTLYDQELFPDWQRFTTDVHVSGARPRTEVIWLNEAATSSLSRDLFKALHL